MSLLTDPGFAQAEIDYRVEQLRGHAAPRWQDRPERQHPRRLRTLLLRATHQPRPAARGRLSV